MSRPVQPAEFPLDDAQLASFLGALRRHRPDLVPQARYYLLGRHKARIFLPPGLFSQPTVEGAEETKLILFDEGLGELVPLIEELSELSLRESAKRDLDHLEAVEPELWNHPAEILDRPWNLERLIPLCDERIGESKGRRLRVLKEIRIKLDDTLTTERRAAERRAKARAKRLESP